MEAKVCRYSQKKSHKSDFYSNIVQFLVEITKQFKNFALRSLRVFFHQTDLLGFSLLIFKSIFLFICY